MVMPCSRSARRPSVRRARVEDLVAAPGARLSEVLELVLEDELRVVEQPADERALAVVHGSGRGHAQEVGAGHDRVGRGPGAVAEGHQK
jgi:hypothetical protein